MSSSASNRLARARKIVESPDETLKMVFLEDCNGQEARMELHGSDRDGWAIDFHLNTRETFHQGSFQDDLLDISIPAETVQRIRGQFLKLDSPDLPIPDSPISEDAWETMLHRYPPSGETPYKRGSGAERFQLTVADDSEQLTFEWLSLDEMENDGGVGTYFASPTYYELIKPHVLRALQDKTIFPWEHVEPCVDRASFDEVAKAQEEYLEQADPCKFCGKSPENLEWIHFRSPEHTWERKYGREGWLTVCRDCNSQQDFFLVSMN